MQELVARVLEEPAAACNGTTWACTLGERSASLVLVACLVAIGVLFEVRVRASVGELERPRRSIFFFSIRLAAATA